MSFLKSTTKLSLSLVCSLGISIGLYSCMKPKQQASKSAPPRVLVFSKTMGWKHTSIPNGIAAIQKMGQENSFRVDTTKNAAYFTQDSLQNYQAVIFLSTTQNVLNAQQQVAFERYIQAGGGFVGIHAAADTEYDWPWYNKLVGAYFASHPNNPNVRKAIVDVLDNTHPATVGLPARWERNDEWYNYKSINPDIKVLAKLDEKTYEGGTNGDNHPIAWYHEYDGGRAFYTGLGHTEESFTDPQMLNHIKGGIKYALGERKPLDYSKSYGVLVPEENRFVKTILDNDLNEPMELAVAADGRVFYTERTGRIMMYNPVTGKPDLVYKLPIVQKEGLGLLGITLDPDFLKNNYVYLYYTPEPKEPEYRKLLPQDYKADAQAMEILNKNKVLKNCISRFTIKADNTLDITSEKVLVQVPIELEASAHHGGSLTFDKDKNLIIATGDNTVPFQSNGHAPIDEIPGRIVYDAQRSAGNTNDLRGKILRIHPEANGTYTIPAGNLFPSGTANTKPEIYAMGLRNPYRIAVHPQSKVIYWGEIGPDAGEDSPLQGPRGYDEFNQAKKAGNFGWPYFIGNTQPYNDYDFATKTSKGPFVPTAIVNNSPNNTGLQNLPPAQSAMVWYPYAVSPEFPNLGQGGRSAMAGEFYSFDKNAKSAVKFPEFYDGALFVFDWMRNWVMTVRLDKNENFVRMEPFLPKTGDFKRPIDQAFGADGVMYMLEYGSIYGIDNEDARLVKIEFNAGNRAPVAKATVSDSIGLAPLKVAFSSKKTYDLDEEDKLTYQWIFNGQAVASTETNPNYTYTANGVYQAILKVTDKAGAVDQDTIEIKVGNSVPQVAVSANGNQSFYWENQPLPYTVKVTDKEDVKIDPKRVQVYFDYNPQPKKNEPLVGHQILTTVETNTLGKTLIANSDCKACHTIDKVSVGPAFIAVAQRYKGDAGAVSRLAQKIIKGGGGNWGEHAMSAHPQVSQQDASEMVKYVLSLSNAKQARTNLPMQGVIKYKESAGQPKGGMYTLLAAYTDAGGKMVGPLTGSTVMSFRSPLLQAEDADKVQGLSKNNKALNSVNNNAYFVFQNIDLKGVKQLTYHYASQNQAAAIEVHTDSPTGPVISKLNYKATGDWNKFVDLSAPVKDPGGRHDLYFVVVKDKPPYNSLLDIDWIQFKQ